MLLEMKRLREYLHRYQQSLTSGSYDKTGVSKLETLIGHFIVDRYFYIPILVQVGGEQVSECKITVDS
jgi:hypothetical protein